jgi:hypothetical protein
MNKFMEVWYLPNDFWTAMKKRDPHHNPRGHDEQHHTTLHNIDSSRMHANPGSIQKTIQDRMDKRVERATIYPVARLCGRTSQSDKVTPQGR